MSDISDGFNLFVDQFRTQMNGSVNYLTAVAERFSELARQHADLCRDLERERVAARATQQSTEKLEAELKGLKEATMRGAFVLVLIDADADAYMFDDKYFSGDPAEGGERAAVGLKGAVQQYLKSFDPRLAGIPVMARAFASGEGLATLLAKSGIAQPDDSHQVVSRFTSGFSQADDLFDFVLVGKGKDRADHKLMAAFRQFVTNPSCRHVLLACCHDNGYVRMLEKFVHVSAVVGKVTMVKSFQTGSEFVSLPFRSVTMENVFKGHRLGPGGLSAYPISSPVIPTTESSPVSPPVTYAARAAAPQPTAAPSASGSRPRPTFGSLGKSIILINAYGHRIDMPLPPRSSAVAESFNRKTHVGGNRFCHMYHLYEKLVIRHKVRAEKCHDKGKCRDPLCFYGHHCGCPGPGKKCHFPAAMHGVDMTSWREVDTALGA
ncbi:hypothetical protein B0I37DRAFT_442664 [Chaetomium sp. MPI-CAGE-AT-0009]|nr:hypothetical protein B0I37DRAFT_442664 [Chaetomium sp. MPI-CAGE-AT-0009]